MLPRRTQEPVGQGRATAGINSKASPCPSRFPPLVQRSREQTAASPERGRAAEVNSRVGGDTSTSYGFSHSITPVHRPCAAFRFCFPGRKCFNHPCGAFHRQASCHELLQLGRKFGGKGDAFRRCAGGQTPIRRHGGSCERGRDARRERLLRWLAADAARGAIAAAAP